MTILPALAVAFAALCIWLTVRIANRRERWAKWTALAVALPVLYIASFVPACWLIGKAPVCFDSVLIAYKPIVRLSAEWEPLGNAIARILEFDFGTLVGFTDLCIRDCEIRYDVEIFPRK